MYFFKTFTKTSFKRSFNWCHKTWKKFVKKQKAKGELRRVDVLVAHEFWKIP